MTDLTLFASADDAVAVLADVDPDAAATVADELAALRAAAARCTCPPWRDEVTRLALEWAGAELGCRVSEAARADFRKRGQTVSARTRVREARAALLAVCRPIIDRGEHL